MRILHTSDWHLGRSFHRTGMLAHQAAWVDHLLEVIRRERVDVLLVAGDIYDRALPSVDAVALFDESLARLAGSGVRVVLTSGNHDSAHRLGFGSRLIDAAGVHLRTSLRGVGTAIEIADEHGPVHFHGLPWLEPETARRAWDLPARSHEAALTAAMAKVRAATPAGVRSVLLAHAFVAGGEPSDSERDVSVGGVDRVPTSVFAGPSYVALGHLHGAQTLSDSVRYSGSPLAYSFSEARHTKGSWLVELDAAGLGRVEFVPAPVPRALARIRGSLEELLTDPGLAVHESSYVEATLTDAIRPPQAMERLRRRFPDCLILLFEQERASVGLPGPHAPGRADHDLALDFVANLRGTPATPAERTLLVTAFDACCADGDADPMPQDASP